MRYSPKDFMLYYITHTHTHNIYTHNIYIYNIQHIYIFEVFSDVAYIHFYAFKVTKVYATVLCVCVMFMFIMLEFSTKPNVLNN